MTRIVCQFSCGAASAVATKLTLEAHPDTVVVNAFLAAEHEDNRRFLADCERWFGRTVLVLRETAHSASPIEVFRRRRYIKGRYGAPCTAILKRALLDRWRNAGDVLVMGFTAEEQDRFDDFVERYPEITATAPLINAGLTKEDCKAMVERAGIVLPLMYRLGYENANCIACVKGGAGYFRAIREDFPAQFAELADVERDIGPSAFILRHRSGPLAGQRFALHELPPGPAIRNEALPSCSFFCEQAEQAYAA